MNKSVYIVILNWRGWQDTIACISSIKQSSYRNLSIVVVDNDSQDESVEQIKKHHPDVKLIETGDNLGFAKGYNVGIRYSIGQQADYIFVLNNDTTLDPNCLATLLEFAERHPQVNLFGPKIYDAGTELYRQWSVKNRLDFWSIIWILSPFRRLIYNTALFKKYFHTQDVSSEVYAIPGSSMFFRTRTLEAIGLFDEKTFLYWEEFIVAEKLLQAKQKTYVVPSAIIWHKESASISKIGARKFIENVKSERYFFRHYLKLNAIERGTLQFIRLSAYLARMITEPDYRKNLPTFFSALSAYV